MVNQNDPNGFGFIPGLSYEQFRQTPNDIHSFPPSGGDHQQGGPPFPGGGHQQGGFPFPGGGQQGGFPFPGGGQQGGSPFPGGGHQQGGFPFPGGGQQGGFPFPGGGHQGGFPFPGGGQHDGFPSHGGDQQAGAPNTPPPSVIPHESVGLKAVDPGGLRGCLHRFTYIWLNNGRSFWLYPTYIGRTSVAGFRWRRNRWEYYGTDLRRIRSFRCY